MRKEIKKEKRQKAADRYLKTVNKAYLKGTVKQRDNYYYCDGYCLVETAENLNTEPLPETFTAPDFGRMLYDVKHNNYKKIELDLFEIIKEARAQGWTKSKNNYLLKFFNAFYNVQLLEKCFSIIDTGRNAFIYDIIGNDKAPVYFETEKGLVMVLPVVKPDLKKCVVIDCNCLKGAA